MHRGVGRRAHPAERAEGSDVNVLALARSAVAVVLVAAFACQSSPFTAGPSGNLIPDVVGVGPNATFANDPFPRSRQHLAAYPETRVRRGASGKKHSRIVGNG